MKPLPLTLKHSGYDLTQVERTETTAIYFKKKPAHRNGHFEAIIIQSHTGFTITDKTYPPSEFYPSSEQWGTYGWSTHTIQQARILANSHSLHPHTEI